jgi:hypothetical protein
MRMNNMRWEALVLNHSRAMLLAASRSTAGIWAVTFVPF